MSEPKIVWETDSQRTTLAFRADGSDLQARVSLKTSGTLQPVESASLANQVSADRESCAGLAAYTRLRAELESVSSDLRESELAAELALGKYTATVATGGSTEPARDELNAARSHAEALKEQHAALVGGATEARAVAVRGIADLISLKKEERFELAKSRLDESLARIAEAIASELPELCQSRIEFRHASFDSADAERLVAPLPTPPVVTELETGELATAHPAA